MPPSYPWLERIGVRVGVSEGVEYVYVPDLIRAVGEWNHTVNPPFRKINFAILYNRVWMHKVPYKIRRKGGQITGLMPAEVERVLAEMMGTR